MNMIPHISKVYQCTKCDCKCKLSLQTTDQAEHNPNINTLPDTCIFADAEIKPEWKYIHTAILCNIDGSIKD